MSEGAPVIPKGRYANHTEVRGGRINPRQIHNKSDFPSEMTVR